MTNRPQADPPTQAPQSAPDGPGEDGAGQDAGPTPPVSEQPNGAQRGGTEGEATQPVLLDKAIAGVGEANQAVLLPAEQARALHDAGHATYLDNAAAHALGLEGEQHPRIGGPAEDAQPWQGYQPDE